jgi:hypothetical protein
VWRKTTIMLMKFTEHFETKPVSIEEHIYWRLIWDCVNVSSVLDLKQSTRKFRRHNWVIMNRSEWGMRWDLANDRSKWILQSELSVSENTICMNKNLILGSSVIWNPGNIEQKWCCRLLIGQQFWKQSKRVVKRNIFKDDWKQTKQNS